MSNKAVLDANLETVINDLKKKKNQSATDRGNGKAVAWMRPPVGELWDGDLTKWAEIHDPFNTDEAEEALTKAYDPADPGNSADSVVLTLQIDYAAQMERAYRARVTQTFPRCIAHLAGREKGHGTDVGALAGSTINYFNLIIEQGQT